MTSKTKFSKADLEDMERRGIDLQEADRQLALLVTPPPPAAVVRACRREDGITVLDPSRWSELERTWQTGASGLSVIKFVPASGAATRMFSFVRSAAEVAGGEDRAALERAASTGASEARSALALAEHFSRLPFSDKARALARERGIDLAELADRPLALGAWIAETSGLGLAALPKGLIPFHDYGGEPRTAFEEHLHEAAGYAATEGRAALHFTVTPEHLPLFESLAPRAAQVVREATGITCKIDFSVQDPATDTIAAVVRDRDCVSDAVELARSGDGRLLFRPSGHGALIANLARLDADIVFIKNIDNIAPERRHAEAASWKRRLGGLLLDLRSRCFELLERLEETPTGGGGSTEALLHEALAFCRQNLALQPPVETEFESLESLRELLRDRLDRPLRVCGMVENVGEPGGGPFWIEDRPPAAKRSAIQAGQIVEKSQIDLDTAEQAAIFGSASHFNPVDLVCSLRDRRGNPYDLSRFTDPATSFVATKAHEGRAIKTLERPGLWNGAMAGWNTVFVEVPLATFTPVKTILDLTRPEHRAT